MSKADFSKVVQYPEYTGDRGAIHQIPFSVQELESIVHQQAYVLRTRRNAMLRTHQAGGSYGDYASRLFQMEQAARVIDRIQKAVDFQWVDLKKEVWYEDNSPRWHWSVDPHDRTTPYPPKE